MSAKIFIFVLCLTSMMRFSTAIKGSEKIGRLKPIFPRKSFVFGNCCLEYESMESNTSEPVVLIRGGARRPPKRDPEITAVWTDIGFRLSTLMLSSGLISGTYLDTATSKFLAQAISSDFSDVDLSVVVILLGTFSMHLYAAIEAGNVYEKIPKSTYLMGELDRFPKLCFLIGVILSPLVWTVFFIISQVILPTISAIFLGEMVS